MLDTNTIVHIKSTKIQKIIKTEFLCAIKGTIPSFNIYIYDICSTWGDVNIPKHDLNQASTDGLSSICPPPSTFLYF